VLAFIIVASLTPAPLDVPVEQGDKVEHLLAYGAAMFWFAMLAPAFRARLAWAVALAGLGVGLEYAQRMTGYRMFDVMDMAADAAGVLLGWGLAVTPAGRLLAWVDRRLR
jgi:VanZ family protein